jgi:Na+/proline symporter
MLIIPDYSYQHEVQTSEMFSTAGRSVKSGLVAAAVVSSWTWAATLLQSSAVAYKYGISGPFFYASGSYPPYTDGRNVITNICCI